jgi:hypothetical protein
VRIVNCGHHPPVKLAAGAGALQVMAPDGYSPPLGLHPHPEARDHAGRFFDLDYRVAAALPLPDLGAAVKRVVRLLLEHSGDGLTEDVAM